ncbi:MAG: ATP-binding cassette domain-containing protein [Clostridia bacterium]
MSEFCAKSVNVRYQGGASAIRQFDLTFSGHILSVFGKECDGKTTLINALAGLTTYEGSFLLDNETISTSPKNNDCFAILEDFSLIPNKSVYENLSFPLTLRGYSIEETAVIVNKAVLEFGLYKYIYTKVRDLSRQVKSYVAMAKIKLVPRKLYLIDDVLKYLDFDERAICFKKLCEVLKSVDGFVIYATSNYDEALSIGDKTVLIYGGVIEQYGTSDELKKFPTSVRAAELASDGNTVFEFGLLSRNNENLYINCNGNIICLDGCLNRLIDESYIGDEVLFAKYVYDNCWQYLLMDSETERTILVY